MSARKLQPWPVPTGPAVLELLGDLERALDGTGPALLPVPGGRTADSAELAEARRLATALRVDEPLGPGEDAADDPTAVVVATSGSTGEPKGVLLSTSALYASADATHARLGGPGHWLLALPARHVAGLQVLLRSLRAGSVPGVLDARRGFRPETFARAAEEVLARPGRHYTSLVPTQLARLVAAGGPGLAALREFDAVLLGGAATPPTLRRRAEAAGVRVVTTYGMSETAGGCVYDGVPLDGVRVRLTERQPGSDTGRIELSGPMLARGYRGCPDATAQVFRSGWFRTGDLGRRTEDGRWEVLGRTDDVINTGGVKVAPVLVERVLCAASGVLEACVVGVADPECGQAVAAAVVPSDPGSPPAVEELCAAVREGVGVAAVPKVIRFFDSLPLRGPGKVDRRQLRSLLHRSG